MGGFPGSIDWVAELIPDLESKLEPFVVDTDETDDELVEIFIEELSRLTGELSEGLADNDAQKIRESAHSIKGMGGTLGLPEISVVGWTIENVAKEGRLSDAMPLVSSLSDWLDSVK
ncbi:MAG: Hpt domain-containing protein [Pontiellaceae bacterium]|nr:Hpt domain-containing protein [Pontiellaceae bacterium]